MCEEEDGKERAVSLQRAFRTNKRLPVRTRQSLVIHGGNLIYNGDSTKHHLPLGRWLNSTAAYDSETDSKISFGV
jgi:hypothetical protein